MKLGLWFKRSEKPIKIENTFETGNYYVFDFE